MTRTNIHLTDLQIRRLKILSKRSGLSVAEIIRRAIDHGLPSYFKPKPTKGD